MATIFKRGGKDAAKGSKWVVHWYDAQSGHWRHKTGYTDANLSRALGERLERESVARREGFTSLTREESIAPIDDQLQQFLTHCRSKRRTPSYVAQLERRIRRVLDAIGARRLVDVTAGKVEATLMQMTTKRGFEGKGRLISVTTRNEYITSLQTFTKWAAKRRKLDHDPLESLEKADEQDVDRVHPRRALSADEVGRLLQAAADRPAVEVSTIRTGKNKGLLGAKVRPAILAREQQKGQTRRLAYLLAIWTGLRRSELQQLEWRDVRLDEQVPQIRLRAEMTKSRRADVLPLHPQLVAELAGYRPEGVAVSIRVLPDVPDMDVMKLDLAYAGIDYGNKEIGFADLHSMRMTLNTLLATHNVGSRVRQAQLRHADPKLTEVTYFDKSLFLLPHAEQLKLVAAIPVPAIPMPGRTDQLVEPSTQAALNLHQGEVPEGHLRAPVGTPADPGPRRLTPEEYEQYLPITAYFDTNGHGPASCDAGPCGKRAKGIEPSTFTLAT